MREFSDGLAKFVFRLAIDSRRWVVVAEMTGGPRRYMDLVVDEDGTIWTDCVSNRLLRPEEALGRAQQRALVALGWHAPNNRFPNWWKWDAGAGAAGEVAERMTGTVRDVFGRDGEDTMTIRMWSSERRTGRS